MTDRTLRSRYERKYILPAEMVPAVRGFIAPFVRPDEFAARTPDHRYPLASLYLDSPDLATYRMTAQGMKNRFKLRVRSYSDDPAAPVYCEVKRRVNDAILKRRACVSRERAVRLATGSWRGAGDDPALAEFAEAAFGLGARPVCRVRYVREAYEATGGEPLRITFDTRLECRGATRADFGLDGPGWSPARVHGTILEIKFTGRFPDWVNELARRFDLQRCSAAKYVFSIDAVRALGLPVAAAPRWTGRPWIP